MTSHNALANSELHEDKGIASAADRELYWANGAGSGEWKPLIHTDSWTYSVDAEPVEFTGLDEFAFVQIDLFGILLNTTSAHHIICQLGNDSGYTTSSVYYNDYWHSNIDGFDLLTGLSAGYYRNSTTLANSGINCSTLFIANFNQPRYTVATLGEHLVGGSSFGVNMVSDRVAFVREQKAYDKLRVFSGIGADITGGTITLTGWRSY